MTHTTETAVPSHIRSRVEHAIRCGLIPVDFTRVMVHAAICDGRHVDAVVDALRRGAFTFPAAR